MQDFNFIFNIIAPPPPVSIKVQLTEGLSSQPTGLVKIYAVIHPPARYNITVTVEYRCLDTGCGSVNIPQCQNNIFRKYYAILKLIKSWITEGFYLSLFKVVIKWPSLCSYNKMTIVRGNTALKSLPLCLEKHFATAQLLFLPVCLFALIHPVQL